jgi:hypothetical protein
VFAASQTSNGSVTINANLIGARNSYKWNGLTQCGAGDIIAGLVYRATPLQSLNGGSGGFVVDTIGVNHELGALEFIIDGGGSPITTGVKGFITIPFGAGVSAWFVMSDQNGSIVVDVLRANNGVPTVSMIGAGNKPTLTAAQYASAAVSGWTSTTLAAIDWLGFNVVSAATVTRVTVALEIFKL